MDRKKKKTNKPKNNFKNIYEFIFYYYFYPKKMDRIDIEKSFSNSQVLFALLSAYLIPLFITFLNDDMFRNKSFSIITTIIIFSVILIIILLLFVELVFACILYLFDKFFAKKICRFKSCLKLELLALIDTVMFSGLVVMFGIKDKTVIFQIIALLRSLYLLYIFSYYLKKIYGYNITQIISINVVYAIMIIIPKIANNLLQQGIYK